MIVTPTGCNSKDPKFCPFGSTVIKESFTWKKSQRPIQSLLSPAGLPGGKVFVTKPFATLQGEFPGQSLRCRIFFVASRAEAEFRMFASTSTIFGRFGAEPSGSWKGCFVWTCPPDMGVISTAPPINWPLKERGKTVVFFNPQKKVES